MQTAEVVDHYLNHCAAKLSPQTVRWYQYKLETWLPHAPAQITHVKPHHITDYLLARRGGVVEQTGKTRSSYTLHGDIQVIRGFLNWCIEQDYLSHFNIKALTLPTVEQKVIEVFSPAQVKQMLQACHHEQTPSLVARDRAIILFLLDTGVRSAELCSLTMDRLDLPNKQAVVMGKGKKERLVGFGAETASRLMVYTRRYRHADPGVNAVFTNKRGEAMTGSGLDQMLYRLNEWVGIEGVRVSAHTFRHTFAVTYLLQGGDSVSLSKLLGHTSVTTTEIYLRAVKNRDLLRQRPSVVDTLFTQ